MGRVVSSVVRLCHHGQWGKTGTWLPWVTGSEMTSLAAGIPPVLMIHSSFPQIGSLSQKDQHQQSPTSDQVPVLPRRTPSRPDKRHAQMPSDCNPIPPTTAPSV